MDYLTCVDLHLCPGIYFSNMSKHVSMWNRGIERERERESDCKGLPCTAETDMDGKIVADWLRR